MRPRPPDVWKTPLLLLILVAISVAFSASADSEMAPGLELGKDIYPITSTMDTGGWADLEVKLRNGLSRNMLVEVRSTLEPSDGYSLEDPPDIFMRPLEQVAFTLRLKAPPGLPAGSTCRVTLTAVKEDGGVIGSDSCLVEVVPTTDLMVLYPQDVLVDQPLSGELELYLVNAGNVPISFTLQPRSDVITGAKTPLISPGEELALRLPYSFPDETDRLEEMVLISPSGRSNVLVVQMVRERDRLHIIFGLGPRLFTTASPNIMDRSVAVLVLGGGVDNIGVEAVDASDGVDVRSEVISEADELDRLTFHLQGTGFSGTRGFTVRAYGFVNGKRITSNEVRALVKGGPVREAPKVSVPAVAGGTAGGLSLIAGSAAYLYSASETFRWRWLLLTVIPLYSLIREDRVLDHFFRGRLYEFVKGNPGVTYTALKEHFAVNNGTLTYHLHRLEREGLLVHRNMGRYKLFYAEGVRIKGCELVVSELDMEMLSIIGNRPGIDAHDLLSSITTTRSRRTVLRHLKQLQRKGLIDVRTERGQRRLYIREGVHSYLNLTRGVVEMSSLDAISVT